MFQKDFDVHGENCKLDLVPEDIETQRLSFDQFCATLATAWPNIQRRFWFISTSWALRN
jgi:hypothetical protein